MDKKNMRSTDEKFEIVQRYLNGESRIKLSSELNVNARLINKWARKFKEGGIEALESKTGKTKTKTKGNPHIGKGNKKHFSSREEELEHKVMMLEIENARLKKGYLVKGDGAKKEFVTTLDVNMK